MMRLWLTSLKYTLQAFKWFGHLFFVQCQHFEMGKGYGLGRIECKCVLKIVSFEIIADDGWMLKVLIQSVFNLV